MHGNLFKITAKITSLVRSGRIAQARQLFDEMPVRDVVAWNSILTGYSQLCLQREALSFFQQMRASNTRPDHFTFTATLSLCAGAGLLWDGAKLHAQVVVSGYQSSLPVNNSLIDMYGKCWRPFCAGKVFEDMSETNDVSWCSLLFAYTNCGQFDVASEVFSLMPRKIDVAWNTMISGLGRYGQIERCLDLLKEMRNSLCEPDQWTYSALMNACTESLEFFYGCMVHAIVTKSGWICAVEASNSLLSFYAKFGSIIDATNVFKSTGMQSQFSWNAIIDAYMQVGEIHEAFITFQNMPEKNVVSWTSMIAGYTRHGYGEEALGFFIGMMRNCLLPDECAFGAVLHTCSNLAVLGHGRMFHGCIIHYGFHAYAYVGNGLVNMYAKCGDIDRSILAFNDIFEKDLVSFNAMLFAFGLHGKAKQALQLYEDMVASGTDPDKVTFVGLLMTCSHSGLVEKGRAFFESMSSIYGLSHETDHVACMVDMLGRSGFLAEAKELAIKYCKADEVQASSCEALLGACYSHGELRIGNYLGEALNVLQPYKETSYVLRSNLYCTSGQWKEAEMLRKAMVDEGLKKMPGCSWIEVNNKVTAFVAGNHSHPTTEDLCRILPFLDSGISYSSFCHFEN